jgi:transcriptional regulator with XRE-family HTH domain
MSIGDFNQKKFLKTVRAFMKANKISVRKFAKLSGVAFATLYKLENSKSEITLTTIKKLEKAMSRYESA